MCVNPNFTVYPYPTSLPGKQEVENREFVFYICDSYFCFVDKFICALLNIFFLFKLWKYNTFRGGFQNTE